MSLNLGQLVGGAGVVARRQSDQELRMYQQREQQLRLEALNRAEKLRREGAWDMPAAAPMSVAGSMGTPLRAGVTAPSEALTYSGYEVPAELLEPSAPITTQPAAPAPTAGRPEGVSRVGNVLDKLSAQQQANAMSMRFSQSLSSRGTPGDLPGTALPSRIYGYFADTPEEERQRTYAREAESWFTENAADIFMQVPDSFKEAEADPLGFYEKYKDYGKQAPAAGLTPPTAPAAPAAPVAPAEPIAAMPEPTLMPQLPAKQESRYNSLTTRMPQELEKASTQALVQRAQELGVDPAAALAVYALENNYGGTATSGAGARGTMQVMKVAYDDVLRIFPDSGLPANYNDATTEQLQDAGLLYIKALQENYGVATNLLGAAYHAGPRKEIREGRVPGTYDKAADIATADHNAMFVGLYNNAAQILGSEAVEMPAGGRPPAGLGEAKTPSGISEKKIYDSSQFYLANPNAVSRDMQFMLNRRSQMEQYARNFMYIGTPEMVMKGMELQAQLTAMDERMYYLQGMQGLQELSFANDPRRLSAVWSEFAGVPVQIVPRQDGLYDVDVNGVTMREGVSQNEIVKQATLAFSEEARSRESQMAMSIGEKALEFEFWNKEENVKLANEIQKTYATLGADIAIERAKQKQMDIVETMEGLYLIDNTTGHAKLLEFRPGVDARSPLFSADTPKIDPSWQPSNIQRSMDPGDILRNWRGQ